MRKKYIKPEMEVYEFDSHQRILAGSSLIDIHNDEVPEGDDETLL